MTAEVGLQGNRMLWEPLPLNKDLIKTRGAVASIVGSEREILVKATDSPMSGVRHINGAVQAKAAAFYA